MELKKVSSTINETWKLFTFGSFLGCFILLIYLNQSPHDVSLSAARTAMPVELAPLGQVDPPTTTLIIAPEPKLEPKPSKINVTIVDHLEKETANLTVNHVEKATNESMPKSESEPEPEPQPLNVTIVDHLEIKNLTNLTINPIEKAINETTTKKCNMFDGRWVYNPEEVPSYNSTSCPFIEDKMSCKPNGRPDLEYEKWRWEAKDCDVPLFNATHMLERLRNKRMIIVGDSLNRNQWESLACLLYSSISPSRAEVDAHGPAYKVFKAKDYNFILEFYWSPFLIEFNEEHKSGKKVLVLDQLSPNSNQWIGADIMVFNSGHWWTHIGKFKVWDLIQYKGELLQDMQLELAYERGLSTWAKWIETNVDPKKTSVFFRSISAEHKKKHWCYEATKPIMDESYESLYPNSLIDIVKGTIKGLSKSSRVKYLNITNLSKYRSDAHPSIFRTAKWKIYTQKYKSLIPSYADCSHWCLPGVPDTWNRLLYASLFFGGSDDMSSS